MTDQTPAEPQALNAEEALRYVFEHEVHTPHAILRRLRQMGYDVVTLDAARDSAGDSAGAGLREAAEREHDACVVNVGHSLTCPRGTDPDNEKLDETVRDPEVEAKRQAEYEAKRHDIERERVFADLDRRKEAVAYAHAEWVEALLTYAPPDPIPAGGWHRLMPDSDEAKRIYAALQETHSWYADSPPTLAAANSPEPKDGLLFEIQGDLDARADNGDDVADDLGKRLRARLSTALDEVDANDTHTPNFMAADRALAVAHREDDQPCGCDYCMSYGAEDSGFDWYKISPARRIVLRVLDSGDDRLAAIAAAFREHEEASGISPLPPPNRALMGTTKTGPLADPDYGHGDR